MSKHQQLAKYSHFHSFYSCESRRERHWTISNNVWNDSCYYQHFPAITSTIKPLLGKHLFYSTGRKFSFPFHETCNWQSNFIILTGRRFWLIICSCKKEDPISPYSPEDEAQYVMNQKKVARRLKKKMKTYISKRVLLVLMSVFGKSRMTFLAYDHMVQLLSEWSTDIKLPNTSFLWRIYLNYFFKTFFTSFTKRWYPVDLFKTSPITEEDLRKNIRQRHIFTSIIRILRHHIQKMQYLQCSMNGPKWISNAFISSKM